MISGEVLKYLNGLRIHRGCEITDPRSRRGSSDSAYGRVHHALEYPHASAGSHTRAKPRKHGGIPRRAGKSARLGRKVAVVSDES
jgi:hypothetical protein